MGAIAGNVPLAWSAIPAFGFSETMQRPVNKSPLDTRRTHSGTDFFGDEQRDRQARITNFNSYAGANPGAQIGGTGKTGLSEFDSKGWANLMERQQQQLKDLALENGKAAPTVRVGAYDGSNLDSGPAPKAAKGRSTMAAAPAMKGLTDALGGMGGGGRLPQTITDDPELYKAYTNMLLDEMQSTGRQARVAGMSPAEHAVEGADSRIDDIFSHNRAQDRFEDSEDVMSGARTSARAWPYKREQLDDTNRMAMDLADRKGVAAGYDDQIRVGGQLGVAGIKAGVDDRRTNANASSAALAALQREVGNQRQYSDVDPAAQQRLNGQLGVGPGGAPGGAPGGGAPGGKPLPRAQYEATKAQMGWDDATAQQMLRQHGYTLVD